MGRLPAAVDVVHLLLVQEVGPVGRELVVGVQHALHREVGRPGVGAARLQYEHAVVHGRAVDRADGILQRGRVVPVRCGREDGVPLATDVVNLGRPKCCDRLVN